MNIEKLELEIRKEYPDIDNLKVDCDNEILTISWNYNIYSHQHIKIFIEKLVADYTPHHFYSKISRGNLLMKYSIEENTQLHK